MLHATPQGHGGLRTHRARLGKGPGTSGNRRFRQVVSICLFQIPDDKGFLLEGDIMFKQRFKQDRHAGVSRRNFIQRGAGTAFAVAGSGMSGLSFGAGPTTLARSFPSLTNPYHAALNNGAQSLGKSVRVPYAPLTTEGGSEKGIADIRALLQKTGGNLVLNVDPNDSADARV